MLQKPLVTIITSTYNAGSLLLDTIESIRNQNYKNIEYIIVDGDSSDGTLKIIKDNLDTISFYISEKDNGIYDAWNKGLAILNGEWVCFIGAGDTLEVDAIENYINLITSSDEMVNFVSSKIRFINKDNNIVRVYGSPFEESKFKNKMCIAHVGAMHQVSLFNKFGKFSSNYKSAADYEFLLRCSGHVRSKYLNTITGSMLIGGVSDSYRSLIETYKVQKLYIGNIFALNNFLISIVKKFLRRFTYGY